MEEAKGVLASQPKDKHAGSVDPPEEDNESGRNKGRKGKEDDDDDDDEEAALQLQRILDGLEVEDTDPRSQPPSPQPQPPQHPTSPIPTTTTSKDNKEQHTSPFDLPSVPTTLPSTPKPTSTSITTTKTKDPTTSWCNICLANAVVRCQGCYDNLYCWGCWTEGHVGEAAGWEERGHRWVGVGAWRGRGMAKGRGR